MPSNPLHDADLLDHLNRHPELKQQVQDLLQVVGNTEGDVTLADTAEERVIEQLRKIGTTSLTAWAQEQTEQTATEWDNTQGVRRAGKKNAAGTPR